MCLPLNAVRQLTLDLLSLQWWSLFQLRWRAVKIFDKWLKSKLLELLCQRETRCHNIAISTKDGTRDDYQTKMLNNNAIDYRLKINMKKEVDN